jgi:hypothetical protein
MAVISLCVVVTLTIPTQEVRATYWESEYELSFDEGTQGQATPSISVNGTDVHAVWMFEDGVPDFDVYHRLNNGTSWGSEEEISTDIANNQQFNPSVAAEGGRAHAVWQDTIGGDNDIYYRFYDGTTWQPGMEISSDGGMEIQSFPAVDAEDGNVHVVWQDQGDGDFDIYYRNFDGTSWQAEQEISTDGGTEVQYGVAIAVNGSKVHVVWVDGGGGDSDIYYRLFDGTSWQPEVEISTDTGTEPQNKPSIAAYGNEVCVVWLDVEDGDWDVYYRLFDGTSWQAEQEISTDTGTENQDEPSIGTEGGKAYVAWQDFGDGDLDIYYRHFDGVIWQPEQEISTDTGSEFQYEPSISVEGGMAHVVWEDTVSGDWDIFYRRFNGTAWEVEERITIDPSTGFQYNPSMSVEGSTVHVVWHDDNGGDLDIQYRLFDGTVWQPEFEVSTDTTTEAQFDPSVAADGVKVHVVWQDAADGDWDLYYRQFDGTSWLAEVELSSDSGTEIQESPSIAAEGGRVYVVWQDWGDGDPDIYFRYFDGATWQPEQELSTDSGTEPQMNPSITAETGNAYVVWQDMEGGDFDILYRRFDGVGWQPEEEISTDSGTERQYEPSIAVEGGKVYTAWRDHGDGDLDVYYRHHDGISWQPEMEISSDVGTESQQEPSVAVQSGRVHIVWQDGGDGDNDIYYRHFDGTTWFEEEEISTDSGTEMQAQPIVAVESEVLHIVWADVGDGDYDIYYKRGFEDLLAPMSNVDPITPYWQGPVFDVNWTAVDNFDLANVSLYFRYSSDNSSWGSWQEYAYNRNISGPFEIGTFIFIAPYGEGHYEFYTVANDSSLNQEVAPLSADGVAGLDFTPPDGTIVINSGDPWTTSTSVTLFLTYTDKGSGVRSVRYSNDGVWDTEPWENPSPTKAWTLPGGDGNKRVYYQIRDWWGNVSPRYSDEIGLDTTPPICSITINSGDPFTQTTSVSLQLTYSDETSGPNQMRLSNDGTWDTEPWQPVQPSSAWTLTGGDGLKTVYLQVEDNAGLVSSTETDDITLDTTPPSGSIAINGAVTWTNSASVNLDLAYSDATSGVNRVRYGNDGTWDTEPWESPSPTKAWTLMAGDGVKTVYYQVQDNAGLVYNLSDDIVLDTAPPVGSIIINNDDSYANSTSVVLSLTYADGTSGVYMVRYSNDGVWDTEPWESPSPTKAWTMSGGDGIKIVYYQVKDNVNWSSTTYSDSIILDTSSPTGSILINNGDGWTSSSPVSLTLTYMDSASGVSQVRYSNDGVWDTELWESPSPAKVWTLTAGDGIKTVYYQIMDNVSLLSPTYSDDIALDSTPPTGSIVISNGDTWTTSMSVALTLTYADTASGVQQVRYSNDGVWDTEPWESPSVARIWSLDPGDGLKVVYYQMMDYAGWSSITYSDDIILDSTSPVGSIVINNGDEWTNAASVTLTLTYSDPTSGVYQVRFSNDGVWDTELWESPTPTRAWSLEPGDGIKVVFFQVRDNVSLESATYFDFIGLDTIPPAGSIVINNGDAWTSTTSVTLTLMYTDSMAGVNQVRYSDDGVWDTEPWEARAPTKAWTLTSGDGTKTVYYQIMDGAGSVSSTYSDDIILDTTPPTGSIQVNAGDTWANSELVTLSLTYSDSGSGVYLVRYSNDGVWDTEPWELPSPTKAWTLTAGDGTKTAYYQIMDNAGAVSATFLDDIDLDTAAPTGSIVIGSGEMWTTSASVTLTLTYSDSASGVYQVRYSNDGVWDTEPWESPSPTKTWNLDSGDGSKTVYYQIVDNVGWESISFSDDILLDTTVPTGSIVIDDGNATTTSTSVVLTLTYTDETSGVNQVRLSNDGVWDTETWETPITTRGWTLEGPDGTKTVFYQVMDNAGSISSTYSDEIEFDATAPSTVSSIPASGATEVDVSSDIIITFSEEMDQSSTQTSISLLRDTAEVAGTVAWSADGKTLYFIPSEDLEHETTYRIVVSTGAKDISGNQLAAASEVTFTTEVAEEVSTEKPDALATYWWIIPLVIIILILVAMLLRKPRAEVEEDAEEPEEEPEEESEEEEEEDFEEE